jgi:hypothetical protein
MRCFERRKGFASIYFSARRAMMKSGETLLKLSDRKHLCLRSLFSFLIRLLEVDLKAELETVWLSSKAI